MIIFNIIDQTLCMCRTTGNCDLQSEVLQTDDTDTPSVIEGSPITSADIGETMCQQSDVSEESTSSNESPPFRPEKR